MPNILNDADKAKLLELLDEIADMQVYAPEGGHEEVQQCNRLGREALSILRALPAQVEQASAAWENSEGWESLAWELCADEHGEEACNDLLYEGGPIPEPWGERWQKYEGEAKRLIALVRKHASPTPAAPAAPEPFPGYHSEIATAIGELSSAMGCPAVYASRPASVLSETVREAARRLAAPAAPAGMAVPDLCAAIINLPARDREEVRSIYGTSVLTAYYAGHRDARHAAAELVATSPSAQAAPARGAMTETDVWSCNEIMELNGPTFHASMPPLMRFVRAVERFHGIGTTAPIASAMLAGGEG